MAKPIVITDDSVVNSYGFRVMSDGGDLSDYLRNPIMLFDHTRRYGENHKDILLPIGRMTNLMRMGTQWIATPEFDLEDEFAAEIARKYGRDILNMASIGFEALEWSADPELMLPGQTLPTVTKWKLKEVSITDIGANGNCTKLSHLGQVIQLNEKTKPEELKNFFKLNNNPTMKKVIAVLNGSKLVTLPESATDELAAEAVSTLIGQLSAKDSAIQLKDAEIVRLTAEVETNKKAALTDKAVILVEGALTAKKIVAAQKEIMLKNASASEEGYQMVKSLLDGITGYTSVIPGLSQQAQLPDSKEELVKLYDKHAKEGNWKTLSEENIKVLWKAKHGTEIKSETLKALSAK